MQSCLVSYTNSYMQSLSSHEPSTTESFGGVNILTAIGTVRIRTRWDVVTVV